ARDFVNPPELLELLARLAEIAEHLSIQAEFVDAAGIGIRAVEHLVRRGGDAERPRRARGEAAAGLQIVGEVGLVADRRLCVFIERHVDLDLALERAIAIEHLDAAGFSLPVVATSRGIARVSWA